MADVELAASWVTSGVCEDACPVFRKAWHLDAPVANAELAITCVGVYEATINGRRVGDFVMAPGWTCYESRLQVQRYDVTDMLGDENELCVTVGKGWALSPVPGFVDIPGGHRGEHEAPSVIAELSIELAGGSLLHVATDATWEWAQSPVRFSELYDGECFDASFEPGVWRPVISCERSQGNLIEQEGEIVREIERIPAREVLHTPDGRIVVDFGQEVTGYVEFTVDAQAGDEVHLLHGEVLDQCGNFYNENYRSARSEVRYVCRDGLQTWHPSLTYFGFRYVLLETFPGEPRAEQFSAVAVHSDMRRTGYMRCANPLVNRLFENVVWGLRGNFLDVPTDCPQRDERLGWTGDAQAFAKAATYLFDTQRFFSKWLRDLVTCQRPDGAVGQVVPDCMPDAPPSAGWGDAATIIPWQLYQAYDDESVLAEQFTSMRAWVDYITASTTTPFLWTGGTHFGDWLGLDAAEGSYEGASRKDLIATAFYARSCELVVAAGRVLGKDVARYERLHCGIVEAFRREYPVLLTQTEHALAVAFDLVENPALAVDLLARMIEADGTQLRTGFIGTPHILHALSRYGKAELAWSLMLRTEYPSWLYPVTRGATTIWEHWDGIKPDGSFWSADMNSFNHYSYGAVADWLFEGAAGIAPAAPGFAELRFEPHADPRMPWLEAKLETPHGRVRSRWEWRDGVCCYELDTPVPADVRIGSLEVRVGPGRHSFAM